MTTLTERKIFDLGLGSGTQPEFGEGWDTPTRLDAWTNAPVSVLFLPAPAQVVDHFIVLHLRTRFNLKDQPVRLTARGVEITRFTVTDNVIRAARIPARLIDGGPMLPIALHMEAGPVAVRLVILQPDNPAAPPPTADTDPSDRAMMLRFESMGENCEFGLAQRAAGAEPLGLMRFASTNLQRLLAALDAGFAGLGDPDKLQVEVSENGREYMVHDNVFGLHYHAWVKTEEMPAEDVHRREVRRMPFLIRKLTEDLEAAHKIFVRRERGDELASEAYPLLPALRRWGPNTLLYVRLADADHPPETVEWTEPGLLVGYISRFAPGSNAHDFLLDEWIAICRKAQALVWPHLAPISPATEEAVAEPRPPIPTAPALPTPALSPVPGRPVLSCRLSLRLQNGAYVDSGGANQSYATLHQLEVPPFWARLIFFNDRAEPHRIGAAAVAATSQVGDEIAPVEGQPWRPVTFNAHGSDSEPLDPVAGEATALDIPGNPFGPGRLQRALSDWVALPGLARTDGGDGALLLVRSFTHAHQRFSGCSGRPDPAIGRLHAAYWAPGDATQAGDSAIWHSFDGLFASYGLQYVTAQPGATVVGIGDSIMQGFASTGQLSTFGLRACAQVSRPDLPVSWFNESYPGRNSRHYAQAGLWAIQTLRPQVTLIQTWSENDPPTFLASETAFARAVALADATRRYGGVPILVSAAPVFAAAPNEEEAARQASLARLRACARAGLLVLDLDALWGTGAVPNTYRPAFDSGDHRHQNDAGCAVAAEALAALLRDILGLS